MLTEPVTENCALQPLRFAHAQSEVGRLAGKAEPHRTERSQYPHFFAINEEAGIVGRVQRDPMGTGQEH